MTALRILLMGLFVPVRAAASGGACGARPFSATAGSATTVATGQSSPWLRLNDPPSTGAPLAFASSCGAEDEVSLEVWRGGRARS